MCLSASGNLASAQNWGALAFAPQTGASTSGLSQQLLATEIPVTGKAKKLLVTVSGHVGQASINYLSGVDQEALYIFIRSETDRVGNLRFTLPIRLVDRDGMRCAMLGPNNEAMIELPGDAEIKLTIRAKKLVYLGANVNELQSELEVQHTRTDGATVTQKLNIVPNRLFERDGHKCKDMQVEFDRSERTRRGKYSRTSVCFDLRELRSEDFEGKRGGPPVFES